MNLRYYARLPLSVPNYAQDQPTYILIGRWCHLYSPKYEMWFIVDPAPLDPAFLNRPGTELKEITRDSMLCSCGERLRFEEFEEKIGFRLKPIAKWLIKWIPFAGRIKTIRRISILDDEDSPEWWRERQMPQIGVSFAKKETME